jgi:hypothetical protein
MILNHNCGYFSGVGSGIAGNVWWLGEVPPCRMLKFSTKACGGILPNHCYKPFLFVFGLKFKL